MKRVLKIVGGLLLLALLAGGGYVALLAHQFDASLAKVYDLPLLEIQASSDPQVIERGRHLAHTIGGCYGSDCHGSNFAGGETMELGPIGRITGPNITPAGVGGKYGDGELARLLIHGVKRDGHTVRFMPVHEIHWLPDSDVQALISYLRTLPPVERSDGPFELGLLGKIIDRKDGFVIDVARRIDHSVRETPPSPEPTARYGAYLARGCTGCHGEGLSGGKIPGAPPDMAIPANITPDATGLASWSYDDFLHLLATRERPDGRKVAAMMPTESLDHMNDVEKQALWAYLRSVEPRPFGQR